MSKIVKLFAVSVVVVLKWIRKAANNLQQDANLSVPAEIIMLN